MGFFAQSGEMQPLMDLLIVEQYNPTDGRRPDIGEDDRLRALGLSMLGTVLVSPRVPEFVLTPTELDICPTLRTSRSWALWGNRTTAAAARPHLSMYNGDSDTPEALGHGADREARDVLLALSITELVEIMQGRYTTVRDTARKQHDSFSSCDLQSLRRQLLTLSIDLASLEDDVPSSSLEDDVPSWWERRGPRIPTFVYRYVDGDEILGDLTEHLRSQQSDDLTRLSKADHTIRDILGTVAALGSARDTRWVSRAALAVAGEVLAVANKGGKPLAYFRGGFGHFTAAQDEQLYCTLKQRLLRGELELGAAIDLEAVSAETNSDLNALEKAFGRLIGDDLVVRADSGEYRVRPFTAEMACEAFELREVLAREAIRVITAEPPSSLTRELEKALEHMAQEIRENTFLDFSRYVTANCQFYRTLIGGMNNAAAVRAFDSLNIAGIMERSFGLTSNTSENNITINRSMLDAIKHRLPRDAWTYLREYTNMAKDRVREIDSTHSHAF